MPLWFCTAKHFRFFFLRGEGKNPSSILAKLQDKLILLKPIFNNMLTCTFFTDTRQREMKRRETRVYLKLNGILGRVVFQLCYTNR